MLQASERELRRVRGASSTLPCTAARSRAARRRRERIGKHPRGTPRLRRRHPPLYPRPGCSASESDGKKNKKKGGGSWDAQIDGRGVMGA